MDDLNFLAIAVAAVVVLVVSTVYYIAWSKQLATLSPAYADAEANARPPAWKVSVELIRNLVLAAVVAKLAQLLDVVDWTGALQLGLALWVGFPIVLWTGAVMWERVQPKLAAIHAGDWLLKILVIAVIVALWR
jgi:hypothetical protein